MRESPATAIRDWALQWPPAPIPARAMRAVDSSGLAPNQGQELWLPLVTDEVWVTFWLFVAEALEAPDAA